MEYKSKILKVSFLFSCIFLTSISLISQERIDVTHPLANKILPTAGQSNPLNRNINHPDATEFQHIKKSTCMLTWKEPGLSSIYNYTKGSCSIINTLNNSFNQDGSQRILLLTAYHNNVPVGKHLENVTVSEFGKKQIFLSFDYEIAHSDTKRPRTVVTEEYATIRRVWRIELLPLVQDSQSDIALYEIVPGVNIPTTISNSEIFKHFYAAGWSLHLNDITKSKNNNDFITQISHPEEDWKKFMSSSLSKENFIGPGTRQLNEPIDFNELINTVNKKLLVIPKDDLYYTSEGSSGAPVFDFRKRVSAVHSGSMTQIIPSTRRVIIDIAMESLLENSWYYTENENGQEESNIQSILDPLFTYLSYTRGGYLNNLIPNEDPDEAFFNLEIDENGVSKDVYLNIFDFYKDFPDIFENSNESILGHGIIPENYSNNPVILTLKDNEGRLIYQSKYDNDMASINTRFKGKDVPFDPNNPFSPLETPSTDIKNNVLDIIEDQSSNDSEIIRIKKYFLNNANISLKTQSGTSTVRAIKLPYITPYNAVELFKPERFNNLWRSYKFRESRGMINKDNQLYSNKTNITKASVIKTGYDLIQDDMIENDNGIPLFDNKEHFILKNERAWEQLSPNENQFTSTSATAINNSIPTGFNGGYLNLVNPNYKIGPVELSYRDDEKVKLSLLKFNVDVFVNTTPANYDYAVWIDYFPLTDVTNHYNFDESLFQVVTGENTTNLVYRAERLFNYFTRIRDVFPGRLVSMLPNLDWNNILLDITTFSTWLFENAGLLILSEQFKNIFPTKLELVKKENNHNGNISFTYAMPFADQMPLLPNFETRLRLTVAPTGTTSGHPSSSSTFDYGEVEDYLIQITQPKDSDGKPLEQSKESADIYLKNIEPSGNVSLENPTECPSPSPSQQPTLAIQDVTLPNTCNADVGCDALGNDCSNLVSGSVDGQGNSVINFSNTTTAITVDYNNVIVHNATNSRTVSIDTFNETFTDSEKQMLFDEGGGNNGFSLIFDGDKAKLGVKIDGVLKSVSSNISTPTNQWSNITGVFEEGKMYLYVDGQIANQPNTYFYENQQTSIPEHLDDSGWGGTIGSNIWDFAVDSFNGLSKKFLLWSEAISSSLIALLANNTLHSSTVIGNKSAIGSKGKPITETHIEINPPDFSIYPNPAIDKLNILVEVRQEGPLQIHIYDMSGRQVYTINRPKINQGHQLITLPVENLSAGNYIVKIRAGDVLSNEQVIIK